VTRQRKRRRERQAAHTFGFVVSAHVSAPGRRHHVGLLLLSSATTRFF
jgi:hypothetical protein